MNINIDEKDKIKLLNSDHVYDVMQKILSRENEIDRDKEHFWIVGLAINNKLLFIELVSMGSMKATVVEPINVFRVAVLKNAVKVILVHNHPSGEVKPSDNDKDLTDRLNQVGRILAIEVIDHLIITTRTFLSFADIGLLAELKESTKWLPTFELVERIKKEEARLRKEAVKAATEKGILRGRKEGHREGRKEGLQEGAEKGLQEGIKIGHEKGIEEGERKNAIKMAKSLKENGVDVTVIVKSSGLSKEEIEKL